MSPLFLIAHPSLPANKLQEFLAYARANPGKLTYATIGSTPEQLTAHLASERRKFSAVIKTAGIEAE